MKEEKRKAILSTMQDFLVAQVNDPEAILDQAVLVLVEGFGMGYKAAEKEAQAIVDELWDEAYCEAQKELQEQLWWLEARQEAMMGAWV